MKEGDWLEQPEGWEMTHKVQFGTAVGAYWLRHRQLPVDAEKLDEKKKSGDPDPFRRWLHIFRDAPEECEDLRTLAYDHLRKFAVTVGHWCTIFAALRPSDAMRRHQAFDGMLAIARKPHDPQSPIPDPTLWNWQRVYDHAVILKRQERREALEWIADQLDA